MNTGVGVYAQEQAPAKQCNQRGCLLLIIRILDESRDLSRRLAAPATDIPAAGIAKVPRKQLANSIIGQPRACTNRARAGLVPDHPECEFKLATFAGVAIIG